MSTSPSCTAVMRSLVVSARYVILPAASLEDDAHPFTAMTSTRIAQGRMRRVLMSSVLVLRGRNRGDRRAGGFAGEPTVVDVAEASVGTHLIEDAVHESHEFFSSVGDCDAVVLRRFGLVDDSHRGVLHRHAI